MNESTPEPDAENYLQLLAEHDRALAIYVHGLVASTADAEDILQECKVTMWQHFGKFEPGTNFPAWARKIALNRILNYRRSEKRRATSPVDPAFIEAVAAEIDRNPDHFERRAEALRECLYKLPKPHRQAIVWRYYEDCEVDEIGEKTNRSAGAVYRLLSRIRRVLADCVTETLATLPS